MRSARRYAYCHASAQEFTTSYMAYFFASPIDVDVKLEGDELRKQVEMKGEKEKSISCPVYYDGESVAGQVCYYLSFTTYYKRPHESLRALERLLFVCATARNCNTRASKWNLLAASVSELVVPGHRLRLKLTAPKNFFTTEDTIMSSCLCLKNLQHRAKCGKPRRSTSILRTWRSSTRATRVSMSNYGEPSLSVCL
jgi:hypothetical protein